MTDEDKQFLIDLIEKTIAHYCDFTGLGSAIGAPLATRIANDIEAEFALVMYKENLNK